jgi:hypothetical protein
MLKWRQRTGICIRLSLTSSSNIHRNIFIRGNQNPYIEEEHTTQWLKEKVQKDKQRSTKHTHKIKDHRVIITPTPLKTGGELRCPRRVSSTCSTFGTRRTILVTNPVICHNYVQNWIFLFILKVANIRCFILIKCSEQEVRFKKYAIMS